MKTAQRLACCLCLGAAMIALILALPGCATLTTPMRDCKSLLSLCKDFKVIYNSQDEKCECKK